MILDGSHTPNQNDDSTFSSFSEIKTEVFWISRKIDELQLEVIGHSQLNSQYEKKIKELEEKRAHLSYILPKVTY